MHNIQLTFRHCVVHCDLTSILYFIKDFVTVVDFITFRIQFEANRDCGTKSALAVSL